MDAGGDTRQANSEWATTVTVVGRSSELWRRVSPPTLSGAATRPDARRCSSTPQNPPRTGLSSFHHSQRRASLLPLASDELCSTLPQPNRAIELRLFNPARLQPRLASSFTPAPAEPASPLIAAVIFLLCPPLFRRHSASPPIEFARAARALPDSSRTQHPQPPRNTSELSSSRLNHRNAPAPSTSAAVRHCCSSATTASSSAPLRRQVSSVSFLAPMRAPVSVEGPSLPLYTATAVRR